MARACLVLFFVSFIVACDFTNGFLTRGRNLEAVFTKDTPVPEDVVEKLAVESVPVEVTVNKQCAKIGEFVSIYLLIFYKRNLLPGKETNVYLRNHCLIVSYNKAKDFLVRERKMEKNVSYPCLMLGVLGG
ncbi:jg25474 [Pararge aegeria aegeria]|uniref:Jg25474 protein n=1 Tax=Pararge aegeria aegeria TaxID=348720 RepID=A0A8S4QT55_9NEOP|nr:jg25474 [Pararge aegeria aegeria]